jgi:hypothetical protein
MPFNSAALRSTVLAVLLGACGARTGLNSPDDGVDGGVESDASGLPDVLDAQTDIPFDIPLDVPADIPLDVPVDVWVPTCPDSVRVSGREASVPVDTIWALDSSFSMEDDLRRMSNNIEVFWNALLMTNVDSRTIFVSQEGYAPSPPAGFSGRFLEVNERVGSYDAFSRFLSAHDFYGSRLRPDAVTHLIVVTDDNSREYEWERFLTEMTNLLGHEFIFHAVASEQFPPTVDNPLGVCTADDGGSAFGAGVEYYELADETGGLKMSICENDWSELFDRINERIAIRIPLPCAYSLPTPPPAGVTYRPERFTVLANIPGEAGPRVVPRVDGEANCEAGADGWWFFEGSDRVQLCASTCAEFEGIDARIEIDLGCDM